MARVTEEKRDTFVHHSTLPCKAWSPLGLNTTSDFKMLTCPVCIGLISKENKKLKNSRLAEDFIELIGKTAEFKRYKEFGFHRVRGSSYEQ